jgi:hypothetical protein
MSALLALAGCAEHHEVCGPSARCAYDAGRSDAGPVADGGRDAGDHVLPDGGESCLPRAPAEHRSAGSTCDHERGPGSTPEPAGGPPADCTTDADCTTGENGRCTGNTHDGWRCTYDSCFADSDCADAAAACECEGGFRSDHNVCLPGNCRTDGDCATGYCSPTFGSCGDYTGTVGYFCHTCEDECLDDADCGGDGSWGAPYCMFEPTLGRWTCSSSHCAG